MSGAEGDRTLNLSIANRVILSVEKLPKRQAKHSLQNFISFASRCAALCIFAGFRITTGTKTLPGVTLV
jgi:hypothetical protein